LLEPESFDACVNVTALIIAILGCSEVDMEVSDANMKTAESDDCRKMSGNNRDANSVLAMMQERTRFFHKDR